MASADNIRSSVVLLSDKIPADNISGWLIWQIVIVVGFIILSLLTVAFFLFRSGLWERIWKKRRVARRKPGKKAARATGRRSGTAGRRGRKSRPAPSGNRTRKTYSGKSRRKKSGASSSLKMPFLPDPNIIRSYTGKYLVGERIKANWKRVSLVGYDAGESPLNLDVYLLSSRFQWAVGKSDAIIYHGKSVKPSKYFKNKALKQALQNADKLISVGLVTELSDDGKTPGLARSRAENMVSWLKQVMPRVTVDYLLVLEDPRNIWGSIEEEDRKADEKRAVLWICLKDPPDGVNMEEAVRDALSQAINLPFDFDIYHDVVLEKIDSNHSN